MRANRLECSYRSLAARVLSFLLVKGTNMPIGNLGGPVIQTGVQTTLDAFFKPKQTPGAGTGSTGLSQDPSGLSGKANKAADSGGRPRAALSLLGKGQDTGMNADVAKLKSEMTTAADTNEEKGKIQRAATDAFATTKMLNDLAEAAANQKKGVGTGLKSINQG